MVIKLIKAVCGCQLLGNSAGEEKAKARSEALSSGLYCRFTIGGQRTCPEVERPFHVCRFTFHAPRVLKLRPLLPLHDYRPTWPNQPLTTPHQPFFWLEPCGLMHVYSCRNRNLEMKYIICTDIQCCTIPCSHFIPVLSFS